MQFPVLCSGTVLSAHPAGNGLCLLTPNPTFSPHPLLTATTGLCCVCKVYFIFQRSSFVACFGFHTWVISCGVCLCLSSFLSRQSPVHHVAAK